MNKYEIMNEINKLSKEDLGELHNWVIEKYQNKLTEEWDKSMNNLQRLL